MCRSIKVLRNQDQPATDAEIEAAALQFVRKISGYRQPSKANADAFDLAVAEIAESSRRLLSQLTAPGTVTSSGEMHRHSCHFPVIPAKAGIYNP